VIADVKGDGVVFDIIRMEWSTISKDRMVDDINGFVQSKTITELWHIFKEDQGLTSPVESSLGLLRLIL